MPPIPRRRAKKPRWSSRRGFPFARRFIAIVSLLLHYRFAQTIVTLAAWSNLGCYHNGHHLPEGPADRC